MDKIILIGSVIFGIGLLMGALNTKWKWQFWKYPFVSRNKGIAFFSLALIIIGLLTVIIRALSAGYLGN